VKNLPKLLILAVVVVNLQSAVQFLTQPEIYVSSFELVGLPGEVAIRGYGVLFLMWSVPYLVAAWNPYQYRIALYEAITMQSIGLVGESIIHSSLPTNYALLRTAILRFIFVDALGLFMLIFAALLAARLVRD